MSLIDLLTRTEKGSSINTSEHDLNLTKIQDAVNALDVQLSLSLTPEGVLKAAALNAASQIKNAIITLAKIADLTAKGILITDANGRPTELVGDEGQRVQFGANGLEAYTPSEADDLGRLLGTYSGGVSVVIPNQERDVRIWVNGSVLLRGVSTSSAFVAKVPIRADGVVVGNARWWVNNSITGGYWSASTGAGSHFSPQSAGSVTLDFGALVAQEGTLPGGMTLSDHELRAMVFAA